MDARRWAVCLASRFKICMCGTGIKIDQVKAKAFGMFGQFAQLGTGPWAPWCGRSQPGPGQRGTSSALGNCQDASSAALHVCTEPALGVAREPQVHGNAGHQAPINLKLPACRCHFGDVMQSRGIEFRHL